MPTSRYKFSPRVQNVAFLYSDDEILLPEAEVAAFCLWGSRVAHAVIFSKLSCIGCI